MNTPTTREPTTTAGRAAVAILAEADIHWPDSRSVVSSDVFRVAVAKAEAEARADLASRLEARVKDVAEQDGYFEWGACIAAVLDAIREEAAK